MGNDVAVAGAYIIGDAMYEVKFWLCIISSDGAVTVFVGDD